MLDLVNLPRWTYASCRKYMKENTEDIITHYEGDEIQDLSRPRVEFRLDGPRFSQQQGCWQLWIAINLVITTEMGKTNSYDKHVKSGILAQALNNPIPAYKYGNGLDDDSSLIGCYLPLQDKFNFIRVYPLGNPDPALKFEQTIVDAKFTMDLSEDI